VAVGVLLRAVLFGNGRVAMLRTGLGLQSPARGILCCGMAVLALVSGGAGCTEPVDCAAEPARCVQQPARPPLKLPQMAATHGFDADKARANLLRLGRRDGLRPVEAADEARLRSGAARAAAAAMARPEAPGAAPMRPDALARAGALPSDTLAARRRPDPQAWRPLSCRPHPLPSQLRVYRQPERRQKIRARLMCGGFSNKCRSWLALARSTSWSQCCTPTT